MTALPYTEDELDLLLADGAPVEVGSLDEQIMAGVEASLAYKDERAEVDQAVADQQALDRDATNEWLRDALPDPGDEATVDSRSRSRRGDAGPGTSQLQNDEAEVNAVLSAQVGRALRRKRSGTRTFR